MEYSQYIFQMFKISAPLTLSADHFNAGQTICGLSVPGFT